jgi:hypothetical protein
MFIGVMLAAMQYPRIAKQYVCASSRGATLVDAPSRGATRGVYLRFVIQGEPEAMVDSDRFKYSKCILFQWDNENASYA